MKLLKKTKRFLYTAEEPIRDEGTDKTVQNGTSRNNFDFIPETENNPVNGTDVKLLPETAFTTRKLTWLTSGYKNDHEMFLLKSYMSNHDVLLFYRTSQYGVIYMIIKYNQNTWLDSLISHSTGNSTLDFVEQQFMCDTWRHAQFVPGTRSAYYNLYVYFPNLLCYPITAVPFNLIEFLPKLVERARIPEPTRKTYDPYPINQTDMPKLTSSIQVSWKEEQIIPTTAVISTTKQPKTVIRGNGEEDIKTEDYEVDGNIEFDPREISESKAERQEFELHHEENESGKMIIKTIQNSTPSSAKRQKKKKNSKRKMLKAFKDLNDKMYEFLELVIPDEEEEEDDFEDKLSRKLRNLDEVSDFIYSYKEMVTRLNDRQISVEPDLLIIDVRIGQT